MLVIFSCSNFEYSMNLIYNFYSIRFNYIIFSSTTATIPTYIVILFNNCELISKTRARVQSVRYSK